jgi:serine/threonine protein kinase
LVFTRIYFFFFLCSFVSPFIHSFIHSSLQKNPADRATAFELLSHPFIKNDPADIRWPFAEKVDSDDNDIHHVNEIVIDQLYKEDTFRNSLFDHARFGMIANQLGIDAADLQQNFIQLYKEKFPDCNIPETQ